MNWDGKRFLVNIKLCSKYTSMKLLFFEPKLCIKTYKYSLALHRMGFEIEMAYSKGRFNLNYELDASHVCKYHKVTGPDHLVKIARAGSYKYLICKDINNFVSRVVSKKLNPILLIGDIQSARTSGGTLVPIEKAVFSKINHHRVIFSGTFIRQKVAELFDPKFLTSPVIPNVPTNEPFKPLPKLSAKDGKIHLVYCGCLQNNDGHRNFNKLFQKILTHDNIILHVLPTKYKVGVDNLKMKANDRLIIHPTVPYQKLHQFLTQFDIGLCLFDMTHADREYIHISEANKFYDYLFANLPQITNKSRSYEYLIEKYQCGECLSQINEDFGDRLAKLAKIPIKFAIETESVDARVRQLSLFQIINQKKLHK